MRLETCWTIADIFNGLMAFPNLLALVCLSGIVVSETRDYLAVKAASAPYQSAV